jgi:hypothetical protein
LQMRCGLELTAMSRAVDPYRGLSPAQGIPLEIRSQSSVLRAMGGGWADSGVWSVAPIAALRSAVLAVVAVDAAVCTAPRRAFVPAMSPDLE